MKWAERKACKKDKAVAENHQVWLSSANPSATMSFLFSYLQLAFQVHNITL
jgi:hypothetical protein